MAVLEDHTTCFTSIEIFASRSVRCVVVDLALKVFVGCTLRQRQSLGTVLGEERLVSM
jgi:hypothetical protein